MSAVPSPNAPSSIARRITARMESSCAGLGAAADCPITKVRSVVAPTNDPALTEMPCRSIASSQAPKP
jgi:hypothetical protein